MLDNVAADGHSQVERVENASHIGLSVAGNGTTPTFVIKVKGAVEAGVDFTAPRSPTNQWDYIQLKDLQDGASINGDTGVAFVGTADVRMLEVNINGLYEYCLEVSGRTNGNAHAYGRQFILQ